MKHPIPATRMMPQRVGAIEMLILICELLELEEEMLRHSSTEYRTKSNEPTVDIPLMTWMRTMKWYPTTIR